MTDDTPTNVIDLRLGSPSPAEVAAVEDDESDDAERIRALSAAFDVDARKLAKRYVELKGAKFITDGAEVMEQAKLNGEVRTLRDWLITYIEEQQGERVKVPDTLPPVYLAVRRPRSTSYRLDYMLDKDSDLFWRLFEAGALTINASEATRKGITVPPEYRVEGEGSPKLEIETGAPR